MTGKFKRDLARLTGGNIRRLEVRNTMQIRIIAVAIVLGVVGFMSAYTVETGNVAVERTLGKVDHEEQGQGLNFKMPFLTKSMEFSAKEIAIDINDLTPKAADNLSLKDIGQRFCSRFEKRLVKKVLDSTNWNRRKAADMLDISYKSLLNKIKAYNLTQAR